MIKEDTSKGRLFLLYFIVLYIGNLASISASNSAFMATLSLPLLHADPIFVGVFVATSRYALIIFSLITFAYAHKIKRKPFVLWGCFFGLLSFLGLSFSLGYVTLFFFAIFYGFAYMVAFNYMIVLLLDYTPVQQRTTVLGLFSTSGSLGTFVGPFFAKLILSMVMVGGEHLNIPHIVLFGFFDPFSSDTNPNLMFLSGFVFYVVLTLCLILAFHINKKLPSFAKAEVVSNVEKEHRSHKKKNLFKELWADYSGVSVLSMLLGSMWITTMTFVPSFGHVIGVEESSWFFLGFSSVALTGRFLLIPQLKRWKTKLVINSAYYIYLSCFVFILLFGFFPHWWIFLIGGCLQGLAHGVLLPSMNILFTHKVPNQTAKSTLAFVVMYHLGTLSNIIFSTLMVLVGYYVGFTVIFFIYLSFIYYVLRQKDIKQFFHKVDMINSGKID